MKKGRVHRKGEQQEEIEQEELKQEVFLGGKICFKEMKNRAKQEFKKKEKRRT